jgi:hypothetical protein
VWSPAGSPHGRRQQKLGEATNSSCSTLPRHQSAPPRASAGRRAPLQPVASVVLVHQDEGLQARARPWRPAGADPRWPGRGGKIERRKRGTGENSLPPVGRLDLLRGKVSEWGTTPDGGGGVNCVCFFDVGVNCVLGSAKSVFVLCFREPLRAV